MTSPNSRDFKSGMRDSIPVVLSAGPFGLLFGALAIEHGLTLFEAVLMSATVYAGASQMVGIELFGGTVAPWLVVLSIFAVNFRHVLYSAAVGRRIAPLSSLQKAIAFFFLVDPQYAETEKRGEEGRSVSFAWYMGMALPVYVAWVAEAWLGGMFGSLIANPEAFGIDFLLPIYFLALVMGFRQRDNWLPVVVTSAVASVAAFHFVGSPWHVSLGAIAGVLVAVVMADTTPTPEPLQRAEAERAGI